LLKQLRRSVAVDSQIWRTLHVVTAKALVLGASQGLWPHLLWPVLNSHVVGDRLPCPVCRNRFALRREYQSWGAIRSWLECPRCRVVSDDPQSVQSPRIEILAPDTLTAARSESADVVIEHGTPPYVPAAAAILIDGRQHGAVVAPAMFELPNRKRHRLAIRLRAKPDVGQLYFLRCILVSDGEIHWRSCPISIQR
jgi:hypothetical protein